MRPVNIDAILTRSDNQLKRLSAAEVEKLRVVLNRVYEDLVRELRALWPGAVRDAATQSPVFAEARARVLIQQLDVFLKALDLRAPGHGVTEIMRSAIASGHEAGLREAQIMLAAFEKSSPGLAGVTTRINFDAVQAMLVNSTARLSNYAAATVSGIEDEIVRALVRGEGVQKVARRIRVLLRGDADLKVRLSGLAARARTIARTEMATARGVARDEFFEASGVRYVQWYATVDERTCEWCGARHGNVYVLGRVSTPAHPNCRCTLVPFRKEWLDAGLVDVETWREQRDEIREVLPRVRHSLTPFERDYLGLKRSPKIIWNP